MNRHCLVTTVGIVVLVLSAAAPASAQSAEDQAKAAKQKASAAVKASPELVGALAKELGSTQEQAAGAAGALFAAAKSSLKPGDFSRIANAVPGMTALLDAAPSLDTGSGGLGAVAKVAGTKGSALATAASAFSKLGLKPDLVSKAIPVLTSLVTKSGGADVGRLLAGVLK